MYAEIGKQILEAIKAYVANHTASVTARVDQVAASLAEVHAAVASLPPPAKGEKGDAGIDGHTPTTDELRAIIAPVTAQVAASLAAEVHAAVASLPPPAKGEKGDAGVDGHTPTTDELRAIIEPMMPAPIPGPRGERGEPGDRGVDGDSPTVEQLRDLVQTLMPTAIPGERGEKGDRGEAGADGHTPTPDEVRAIVGPMIPVPIPGKQGERGIDGKDGQNGVDGRDAIQLEILPSIDEAKCYPRGTYARHAGGLWRSFESTFRMRGWECIVEGIAEETESLLDDGRTLVRRTMYSSGRTLDRSVTMAVILDKGVYKVDAQYAPGDAVTWAGSVWIAQRRDADVPYGKPSTPGSGWRLAVKAGRDARV